MRFFPAILLFFTLLTACTDKPPTSESADILVDKVAEQTEKELGDKTTDDDRQPDLLDPEDLTFLGVSAAAEHKILQRLYADALFYESVDASTDYTEIDTTSYGTEIDFFFDLTFQNERLIAIKTTQQWCAAYCDGAVFGTVFSHENGAVIALAELFDSAAALEAFQARVLADFKQHLANHLAKSTNGPNAAEFAMEREALSEYCQNWQPDAPLLTEGGFFFHQDCELPHVIQAFDFSPELYYAFDQIKGLNTQYFGIGQ